MKNIEFSTEPPDQLNPVIFNTAMDLIKSAEFDTYYAVKNTKLSYIKKMSSELDFQAINVFSLLFSDISMFCEVMIRDNGDEMPVYSFLKNFEQNGEVKRLIKQMYWSGYNLDELNIVSFVLLKKFVHFVD
jgi:hypothetical protein